MAKASGELDRAIALQDRLRKAGGSFKTRAEEREKVRLTVLLGWAGVGSGEGCIEVGGRENGCGGGELDRAIALQDRLRKAGGSFKTKADEREKVRKGFRGVHT
jgi:hypothetical protein